MFKKFSASDVSTKNALKSSVQRSIRKAILDGCPDVEPYLDDILPSGDVQEAKCKVGTEKVTIVCDGSTPLFWKAQDLPFLPTMRLLHTYPGLVTPVRVDRGAIKFLLGGADCMAPGLISAGGFLPDDLEVDEPVAVFCEGKDLPIAIGAMTMTSADVRAKKAGVAIKILHFMGDGLWHTKEAVAQAVRGAAAQGVRSEVTPARSLVMVKNLMRALVGEVCWHRGLFGPADFRPVSETSRMAGIRMHALRKPGDGAAGAADAPSDACAAFVRALEDGAFAALDRRWLRSVVLSIYEGDDAERVRSGRAALLETFVRT